MKLDVATLRKLPLALRVEIEENAQRKPLTQSELAAEQQRILTALRKHRAQGKRTDRASSEKDFSEVRATAIVGKLYGESHKQVEKRQAVVEAAAAEPEKFGKLVADMDRTGCVDGPFKRLKVIQQAAAIRAEPPPYPGRGPYRVGTADPPWPYDVRQEDPSHRATHPYPQMSIAQICAEGDKVRALMHEDSIMWLWTTNYHIVPYAHIVLDAWGFEHKTVLTWFKNRMGTGDTLRGQTEHRIFATRGRPTVDLTNQTTALFAPARANSQKPDEFYALVETLCPAPRYAYLFARAFVRDHWDVHGDEAEALADAIEPRAAGGAAP
jgi:N6-adenosine-specific RNA methylase IME4